MDIKTYRSDIQELIKEVGKLRMKSPDEAINACEKLLDYGEKQRDDALVGFAHFTMGEIYYALNDVPTFYFEMLKCLKPFTKIREWGYLAAVYNMFGIMALNRGNVALAMDYYYRAFEYCIEHKLPEMKVRAQLNLAGLYLMAGNYDDAMTHFDESHKYITNHMNMDGYVECLNAVMIGRGKMYLAMEKMEEAWAEKNEIEQKCLAFLSDSDKLVYNCFVMTLSRKAGAEDECKALIPQIIDGFSEKITVMDVFDDVYEFLEILIEMGAYNEFVTIYQKVMSAVKITTVKNLEKKLLQLQLKYLKIVGDTTEYQKISDEFIDLLGAMDTENQLMLSSIMSLRKEYHKLQEENKAEKKHSSFLKRKSETDPLTGMFNRHRLTTDAEDAMERATSNGVALAIELLDVDYFKEYNDNYGHQDGDKCLIFVAKAIMSLSKQHTGVFCYRYGGDEFVIIYESYSEQEVFDMAKELKNAIHEGNLVHDYAPGDVKQVTISQGIYWGTPKSGDDIWNYLKEADDMLYKVKQKSRNGIMVGKSKRHADEEEKEIKSAPKPLITELKEEDFLSAED